jgi:hypothetical protein
MVSMKHLFVAAAFVSACTADEPAQSPFAPETGVVFVGASARDLINQCSRREPGPAEGTWTPNAAQIAELETKLADLLKRQLQCRGESPDLATGYHRQYGGLVIGDRQDHLRQRSHIRDS